MASTSPCSPTGFPMQLLSAMYLMGCLQVLYMACKAAYEIRLYAIEEYGRVIHEFDPYFNYRATEYLWQHGWKKFFQWFDYQSWYPLGRSVGTTIYPGMQFTSVWIKQFILPNWSINDICCFLPAWFGVLATLSTAGLAYVTVVSIKKSKKHSFLQDIPLINTIYDAVVVPIVQAMVKFVEKVTGSTWGMPTSRNPPALESAVFTACIMSIVPAHLLRSVGGGYDNESVATTAMQLTFLMWTVTCYAPERFSIPLGVLTAIAYFYMVAAWGGYIFVINLVGIHAAFLIVFQTMPWTKLYKSYTSFYFIGTLLAMQVPVVNWAPLRSLEQLGPCGVFSGMQVLQLMRVLERRYPRVNRWKVRGLVVAACLMLAGPVVFVLYDRGYFGPLSSRVRGLFVEHTKTGNPLVDSVAEHQAASPQAYYQYLNEVVNIAPIGLAIVVLYACTPASSFLLLYGVAAYFFSHKMVRLILLTAPIASVCGGIALGYTWAWMVGAIFGDDRPSLEGLFMGDDDEEVEEPRIIEAKLEPEGPKKRGGKGKKKEPTVKASAKDDTPIPDENEVPPAKKSDPLWVRAIRLFVSYWIIRQIIPTVKEFHTRAHEMAKGISHPTIISKGKLSNGDEVLIDDYRQAYLWLKDNTPEDARIMAWWDYGYQITGIANRTTIADGNTWNHEHIALLGRILTSPEKDGHRIARHLADYVLIWAGGGGDDLAKSPHLIRIANSVYRGMCKEPTCRTFGMMSAGQPTPQLEASLLYKLHSHRTAPGLEADRNRFKEVHKSKYGKVRIFKVLKVSEESKEWVKNNRICDAPGSWYCRGQYPPALQKILKDKVDFRQLEDFNVKGSKDDEYTKQYFDGLKNGNSRGAQDNSAAAARKPAPGIRKLRPEEIDMINEEWGDNEVTSMTWELISQGKFTDLADLVKKNPNVAHLRSEDGRGPMWWAYEYSRPEVIELLRKLGVSDERTDQNGVRAKDVAAK